MKFSIVGTGYVGLSLSVLLAQKHEVIAYDIDTKKIELINSKISPIKDDLLNEYLNSKKLNLIATSNLKDAYKNSDYIIISTPTNYNVSTGSFDTSSVENTIKSAIKMNNSASIVIKSTIPFGFVERLRNIYSNSIIFFSPEFLRESNALYDNLYPSRIVVGDKGKKAKEFARALLECSNKKFDDSLIHLMGPGEAESVKLFSNTYLAMRVAFFNELDSFTQVNDLSTEKIIKAVSADSRIGSYYNNPSFGYGGYCLPKDTKQLLKTYKKIPNNIITAVVESNKTRKQFIVDTIVSKKPKTVGIYRLIMKESSDNFRESAVLDIIELIEKNDIKVIIYEPLLIGKGEIKYQKIEKFKEFINKSDIIIANRITKELHKHKNKVYSRDIFGVN